MADYLGDFPVSFTTVPIYFTTHDGNGAPVAPLTAFEAADVKLYKNGSATERTSQAGWTMSSPFDSLTGLHLLLIDTSDNTDAGFYAAGCTYTAVLNPDTETVNSQTALKALATFTIGMNLRSTTNGRTLDVSSGGEAGLDWANIGSPTTTVDLSGTTIKTTQKVDVDTIKTNPVVNGGTITFPTTATLASTTNITAGTVTTATNVTTVNGLAAGVITATSIASDAITAAKIAADAIGASELAADAVTEIQSGLATAASISALNNISTAQVNAEVVDALATDTYAEPGQGAPAATTSLAAKINYLFKAWRNKHTQTSTTYSLMADDTTTVDQKATVSDDGTTFSRGEVASGP